MLPTRQIHLDFHTSEHIKEIGKKFCEKEFIENLLKAKVNGINLFAKCHHSWSYYPTKVGKMHPHLSFDLLGKQIEACKKKNIKAYIYFTVGWSSNDAELHPEWCAKNKNGDFIYNSPIVDKNMTLPHFHWKFLCLNTSYHELILSQVRELCENYKVDGFWFDIYQVHRKCYCENCIKSMGAENININIENDVEAFNAKIMRRHCKEIKDLIGSFLPSANVFFNGTTATDLGSNFRHEMYINNTAQDLEHLPTTWGGYDKISLQSKFFLGLGYEITAMSGKFHTDWGEFGGFKNPDAIKFEAASMIAHGANCNFGDQLHPSGRIDDNTYKCIGIAYDYVEKIEEYGKDSVPVSKLGVWRTYDEDSDNGIAKILLEEHLDFIYVNNLKDLSDFQCIIFPSMSLINEKFKLMVHDFIKNDGSIIVLGKSISNFFKNGISKDFGIKYISNPDFDCDYTSLKNSTINLYSNGPFLNYESGIKCETFQNTEHLSEIHYPYFNRTIENYCSHQKTPYVDKPSGYPGITLNGKCLFFTHDLDSIYNNHGSLLHRKLFKESLKKVYFSPFVKLKIASAARISLLKQSKERRYVLHLLYGPPLQRGRVSLLEDFPEIRNLEIDFSFPEKIDSVFYSEKKINLNVHSSTNNYYKVNLEKFKMHTFVVFNY